MIKLSKFYASMFRGETAEKNNRSTIGIYETPPKLKPRAYVSGKISGLPYDQVVEKFEAAAGLLMGKGYEVVIPTRIVPPESNWEQSMKICIREQMTCDLFVFLEDGIESEGALLEIYLAFKIEMDVMYLIGGRLYPSSKNFN